MLNTFTFSEAERSLLLELLHKERQELAPEIRHTDNRNFRDDLRERRQTVELLFDRLQHALVQ